MWKLPQNRKQWMDARKTYQCDSFDIHTLTSANSASEIKKEQYLALKVLWPVQPKNGIWDFLSSIGFDKKEFERKSDSMMESSEPWKTYHRVLEENYSAFVSGRPRPWTRNSVFPASMGRFELALMDQLDVVELPSSSEEHDLPKVDMTPRVLRDRPKQLVYHPVTPSPKLCGLIVDDLDFRSARQRGSGVPSPPDAQDEAIVNSALVNFLHAVWIDEARESNWTPHRKALKFESRSGGAGFTARTDGHLKVQSFNDRSAAILEVKARARPREDPANHNIAMQESAQMALWIAQEPDNHWTGPDQGKRTKGKQVKSQTKF